MESVFSGKGTLRVSKSYTGKKSSGQGEGTGQGSGSSIKGTSADTRTYDPFSKKTNVNKVETKAKKTNVNKVETKAKETKGRYVGSTSNLGKKGKQQKFGDEVTIQSVRKNKKSVPKENTLDAINKVSMKSDKFVPASKKSKAVPKDNSRKAIKKRKTADKAAGVSKSQMRANKAKSKSEAALAKAKKSKNPDYRAQLKRKSDRLAKRAERKGGSPVKATGDPNDPKKTYGKVTVKKEKKGNTTTVTATRPFSTSGGKKSYKQFEKEGGDVAAAKKFNKGKETKSITVVDIKPIGVKSTASKPAADLSKKPTPKKLTKKELILTSKVRRQDEFDKAHGSTAEQRRKSHNPKKKKKNLFKVKSNLRKRVSRGSNFKPGCF
jgi:hypothetical protein